MVNRKSDQLNETRGATYDFLCFAYDPDSQNMGCYATAYSGHMYSDEQLVRGKSNAEEIDMGAITKTTTVTVDISKKAGVRSV